MAERRMFTNKITESDAFLDMPMSSQCLYFHLCMYADDDGFVKNPKRICRMVGASEDDMKLLIAKSFIITYESGVLVIKHWRMHNLLRKDRYTETEYLDEKSMLYIKENGAYTLDSSQGKPLMATKWQPNGNQMATQDSIGKDSIGKYIKEREKKTPTIEEITTYVLEKNMSVDPKQFFDYYEAGGWKDKDGKPVKSWKQKLITWNSHEQPKQKNNKFHNFDARQDKEYSEQNIMDDFSKMMNPPEENDE